MKIFFFYCNVLFKWNIIHQSEFKPTKRFSTDDCGKAAFDILAQHDLEKKKKKKVDFKKGKFSKYKHQVLK